MEKTKQYLNSLLEQMLLYADYEFIGNTKPPAFDVTLASNGETNLPNISWYLRYDPNFHTALLDLRLPGKNLLLRLTEGGVTFRGMDPDGGIAVFRAKVSQQLQLESFAKYSTLNKFFEKEQDSVIANIDTTPKKKSFDWSEYETDISANIKVDPTAIGVVFVACNRPAEFSKAAESVRNSIEASSIGGKFQPYLFLDRTTAITPGTRDQAELFHEMFPTGVSVKRLVTHGCGRNITDAKVQIFDNIGHEMAFIFEDDLVVSSGYIDTCIRMQNWAEQEFGKDRVGAVQAWQLCLKDEIWKVANSHRVRLAANDTWGYLQTNHAWKKIREKVLLYRELFLDIERYDLRDGHRIRRWLLENFSIHEVIKDVQEWCRCDVEHAQELQHRLRTFITGQDIVNTAAIHDAGMLRFTTEVNFGKNIGVDGIHSNSRVFQKQHLDKIELHEIAVPERFELSTGYSQQVVTQ